MPFEWRRQLLLQSYLFLSIIFSFSFAPRSEPWCDTQSSVCALHMWLMSSGRGCWSEEVSSGPALIYTSASGTSACTQLSQTQTKPTVSAAAAPAVSVCNVRVLRRGEQSGSVRRATLSASVCHWKPAWGCFWQQPLQQIIEQQMKTNDMIAVRVPAVNLLSRWFPFKAIDQLHNLSSRPGN